MLALIEDSREITIMDRAQPEPTPGLFCAPVYNPLLPAPLRPCHLTAIMATFTPISTTDLCDLVVIGDAGYHTLWMHYQSRALLSLRNTVCASWSDVARLRRNTPAQVLACTPKSKCVRLIDGRSRRVLLRLKTREAIYAGDVFSPIRDGCLTYLSSNLDAVSLDVKSRRVDRKRDCRSQILDFLKTQVQIASIQMVRFEGVVSKCSEDHEVLVLWGLYIGRPFVVVFRKSLMSFQLLAFEFVDNQTQHVEEVHILTAVTEDPVLLVLGDGEAILFRVRLLPHDEASVGNKATLDLVMKAAL